MSTSVIENVQINNTELYFSISKNQKNKPIILYLHGGPGDSCIPLTKKFNAELENTFTFVNLEQRGSGLSYYRFSETEDLTMKVILDDIYEFVLYLLKRLNQRKLVVMGHSWGSVLGMLFIQAHPELISQYIGIGQVINMKKTIEAQKDFLTSQNKVNHKISRLDFDRNPEYASVTLTKKIVSNGGSIYGAKNYRKLILPFIFSKDYSLTDLIHRLQGSKQSIQFFWKDLMNINFENKLNYEVPILFCEGRNDFHVTSKLVSEYAEKITSPCRIMWFENSGHFPQWEEASKFNCDITKFLNNEHK
ncbi:alpha/beta fold hydrolase [Lactobacillus xylocopicola]|uniref:Alpha/beta hydrolase n=1 Tax=Lactobacillus xylocopicola TaxID=2976676 RepID=A0ABM8BF36_9LACO|nr:alpha/beta hydrolase [Lactobacillus xylocopicola]BDR59855.1 alpha/beta hydrolase [Lactobacillus xylocopicola]